MISFLKSILFFNQPSRDEWVKLKASTIPRGARILDVGAGSCPYRSHFDHCDYRTHDFEKLGPNQLRDKRGYGTLDYVGDICSIPVEAASFDVVLCTEVLEHVPEPIRAVKEFSRILKPGGQLLLTAPLGSGLHQEPYHFYGGYTPHWYRRFLGEAGFEEIQIEPNRGFFSFYGQECMRVVFSMAPWKGWRQLVWFPWWCLGLPWCFSVVLLAGALDRFDPSPTLFTIGYHVSAKRSPGSMSATDPSR